MAYLGMTTGTASLEKVGIRFLPLLQSASFQPFFVPMPTP
jgi:hypothetical protein